MLQLLALQKAEHAWAILNENNSNLWIETDEYNEGAFVLVELSPTKQVQHVHDAAHWILEIIEQYLTLGVNPTNLQEEVQRAEQWRQSLTLQSQELGRRAWEVEARRDQIQELEESLKHEKQAVDEIMAQLKKASAQLKVDINFPDLSSHNGMLDRPSPEYSSPNSPAE